MICRYVAWRISSQESWRPQNNINIWNLLLLSVAGLEIATDTVANATKTFYFTSGLLEKSVDARYHVDTMFSMALQRQAEDA